MPYQYRDTIGNLGPGHLFQARCITCNRFFEVPIEGLIAKLGADCQVIDAMKRVTCAKCGKRASVNRGYGPLGNRHQPRELKGNEE